MGVWRCFVVLMFCYFDCRVMFGFGVGYCVVAIDYYV